jgi:hypothetical protein
MDEFLAVLAVIFLVAFFVLLFCIVVVRSDLTGWQQSTTATFCQPKCAVGDKADSTMKDGKIICSCIHQLP